MRDWTGELCQLLCHIRNHLIINLQQCALNTTSSYKGLCAMPVPVPCASSCNWPVTEATDHDGEALGGGGGGRGWGGGGPKSSIKINIAKYLILIQ